MSTHSERVMLNTPRIGHSTSDLGMRRRRKWMRLAVECLISHKSPEHIRFTFLLIVALSSIVSAR